MNRRESRHHGVMASSCLRFRVFAFSLIEVLLAIMILGIGVVSIAALFPAGIAQQRQSVDDVIGPIVANNAISILRSKLKPDDFGTFGQFGVVPSLSASSSGNMLTLYGDWPWLRPAAVLGDDGDTRVVHHAVPPDTILYDDRGSIDIFSWYINNSASASVKTANEFPNGYGSEPLYGIPFNTTKYLPNSLGGNGPPRIIITQNERYYPMSPGRLLEPGAADASQPQYVWDCMFRRYQDRILVAIFVYRVTNPGGGSTTDYRLPPNPVDADFVWIPSSLNLIEDMNGASPPSYSAAGAWDVGGVDNVINTPGDNSIALGAAGDATVTYEPFNPLNPSHAWQESRQWILDQNNNIHRVLGNGRFDVGNMEFVDDSSEPMAVELLRPVPTVLGIGDPTSGASPPIPTDTPYFYWFNPQAPTFAAVPVVSNVVTHIWYMPLEIFVDADANGRIDGAVDAQVSLTPVYVTVKEL